MTDILQELNNKRRGVMFVFGAPSGTGKTTVIKKLLAEDDSLNWSVSVTTRPAREGEVDGVDYHFVSEEEYSEMLKNDAFYENVNLDYGNRYGTLRSEVDEFLCSGKDVVFDMDLNGLEQVCAKAHNDVVSIFLLPPSVHELRRRLEGRKTDSAEVINKRMSMAADRIIQWKYYDYVVVCMSPEQAASEIKHIMFAERQKRERQAGLSEFTKSLLEEINK